jgi:Zn-dependent protease with chaperone function
MIYGIIFLCGVELILGLLQIGAIGFGIYLFASLFFIGHLQGNAVKVGMKQFPDIYEIVESHSKKLNLKKVPDLYILQGNGVLNAFATKFAKRNCIVLYSDVLEVAYQEGKEAVSFIIGHELGHIKRNHVGFFKSIILLPGRLIPLVGNAYSRACEYTCDNIGYNLCPEGALKGMLILAVGKRLYTQVNIDELPLQKKYDALFALSFAEKFSTHPALVKRIAIVKRLNRNNLVVNAPFHTAGIALNQPEANR